MKIFRILAGQFSWLKHCGCALTQRGGFESRTGRTSQNHINIIKMENLIKSVRVSAGTRVYYFDVHKDRNGHPYLSITEVPVGQNSGKRKRQRIFVHAEDFGKFSDALAESMPVEDKTDCE